MSTIAESNERVAAAQRRLLARQERLRADLLVLKNSWGTTLTQPLVVGGALLGGFMLSRGARRAPPREECNCKAQGSALFRSTFTALLIPMIEKWLGAAQPPRPENGVGGGPAESALAPEVSASHP